MYYSNWLLKSSNDTISRMVKQNRDHMNIFYKQRVKICSWNWPILTIGLFSKNVIPGMNSTQDGPHAPKAVLYITIFFSFLLCIYYHFSDTVFIADKCIVKICWCYAFTSGDGGVDPQWGFHMGYD